MEVMGRPDPEPLSREELVKLVLRLQRPATKSRTSDRKERCEASWLNQGGLMNMLRRAQTHFASGHDDAVSKLRRAGVVSSMRPDAHRTQQRIPLRVPVRPGHRAGQASL
jgi:hypothetical protein